MPKIHDKGILICAAYQHVLNYPYCLEIWLCTKTVSTGLPVAMQTPPSMFPRKKMGAKNADASTIQASLQAFSQYNGNSNAFAPLAC
ncbi:hypothetical protein A9K55_004630 [Cordyceps militaris]|uniref:Uncharacterized protein n=1 Tax=Cordyceps militaris TaxID=73501 RepID=A0A2H4SLN2_CORMI|nr:hypothetical protein A9K55_004630 [Cordyceps militaris]